MDSARNAALNDPRFDPVQHDELEDLKFEISVLTDPEPLPFSSPEDLLNKLHPRYDGVVLRVGCRAATFLPQVWEHLPDPKDFLNRLSEKAGCEPSAWRDQEAAVSVYHAESFHEN